MDLLPTLYTNRLVYGSNNGSSTNTNTTNNSNSVVNINSNTNNNNNNNTEVNLIHRGDPNDVDDNLPMGYHRGIYNLNYSHQLSNTTGDNNNQSQRQYHLEANHPLKVPRHLSAIPNPMYYYLHLFYRNRVETRRSRIAKTLREIVQIAQEILHEVELQEPRFISTLKVINTNHPVQGIDQKQQMNDSQDREDIVESTTDTNTSTTITTTNKVNVSSINSSSTSQNGIYYDGLRVLSSNKFEITLFLNQMGVFNFMDDGSVPGGAVLKLSDGRKRSMSLWVEFITASGYLSARKIRARFHSLVQQALQKSTYRGIVRMLGQTSEVRLCIRDKYILQITPGFRCSGLWPRSASHWPTMTATNNTNHQFSYTTNDLTTSTSGTPKWPSNQLINEVKREGFCLLSQESVYTKDKQASAEGDAWLLDFYDAEERLLLSHNIRRQCFSILKTLADQYLTGVNTISTSTATSSSSSTISIQTPPVIQEYDIKTLVLHECEKHPKDEDWTEYTLGDRINGILLQLISCLQHRRCPHYFLPQLDIFRGYSPNGMDITAKQTWRLLRKLLTCPQALENL